MYLVDPLSRLMAWSTWVIVNERDPTLTVSFTVILIEGGTVYVPRRILQRLSPSLWIPGPADRTVGTVPFPHNAIAEVKRRISWGSGIIQSRPHSALTITLDIWDNIPGIGGEKGRRIRECLNDLPRR